MRIKYHNSCRISAPPITYLSAIGHDIVDTRPDVHFVATFSDPGPDAYAAIAGDEPCIIFDLNEYGAKAYRHDADFERFAWMGADHYPYVRRYEADQARTFPLLLEAIRHRFSKDPSGLNWFYLRRELYMPYLGHYPPFVYQFDFSSDYPLSYEHVPFPDPCSFDDFVHRPLNVVAILSNHEPDGRLRILQSLRQLPGTFTHESKTQGQIHEPGFTEHHKTGRFFVTADGCGLRSVRDLYLPRFAATIRESSILARDDDFIHGHSCYEFRDPSHIWMFLQQPIEEQYAVYTNGYKLIREKHSSQARSERIIQLMRQRGWSFA